jgi:hypothetical protein
MRGDSKEVTKQVPEVTISDECRWCGDSETNLEWSKEAQCWMHRRESVDKRCLRRMIGPYGEPVKIPEPVSWCFEHKCPEPCQYHGLTHD